MATVLRHRDTPKLLCTLYCIVRESKHGILNVITVKETDDGFSLQGKSYHSMRKKITSIHVYPHATCDNDESIHDTCYVLQFCLPLQLTAACYLQIDMFA